MFGGGTDLSGRNFHKLGILSFFISLFALMGGAVSGNEIHAEPFTSSNMRAAIEKRSGGNFLTPRLQYEQTLIIEYKARVFVQKGQYEEALKRYYQIKDIFAKLVLDNLDDLEWQNKLSGVYVTIGDIHLRQHQIDKASLAYEKSKSLREFLLRSNPGKLEWRLNYARIHEKCGYVLGLGKHWHDALAAYQVSYDVMYGLSKQSPENTGWLSTLSDTQMKIGWVLTNLDRTKGALRSYKSAAAIRGRLAKEKAQDSLRQYQLAETLFEVGNSYLGLKQLSSARDSLERAYSILKPLVVTRPGNSKWNIKLAELHLKLAAVKVSPRKNWREVIDILDRLKKQRTLTDHENRLLEEAQSSLSAFGQRASID